MLFCFLCIPIVAGLYLAYKNNKINHINGLFYQLTTFISLIFISIVYSYNSNRLIDKEYWGSYGIKIKHEEPWNEYIHMTCYKTVSCGKDCTREVPYDCSFVLYHRDRKTITDNLGYAYDISNNTYLELAKKWGNETKIGRHYGHTISGDVYECHFDRKDINLKPIVREHYYKNPVQISNNVVNFEEISKKEAEEYNLYEYPSVYQLYAPSILGAASQKEHQTFDVINSKLGHDLQLKIFVLIFDTNRLKFQYQMNYWKGGNKNELVICIGVDKDRKISWGDCFSWTDSDLLKVEIKNKLATNIGDKLDLVYLGEWLKTKLPLWQRKHFSDFDYLNSGVGLKSYLLVFIFTLLCSIATFILEYYYVL